MGWQGQLQLHYRRDGERTTALDRHQGPLRVLKRLYPEGPGICHHVLVHPPGGIVGGDVLALDARLEPGCHALITTPGAARFYRSAGELALQRSCFELDAGARLEWLPLEAIAYAGCRAENQVEMRLAPGAQALGWDLLALGLPAAGAPFDSGEILQRIHLPGLWLEQGRIRADDHALLNSPLGLDGQTTLATMWWACGSDPGAALREAMLDAARACLTDPATAPALAARAGVTAPDARLLVLRVLAPQVEPALALLCRVRAAWRRLAWDLAAEPPRIWRT